MAWHPFDAIEKISLTPPSQKGKGNSPKLHSGVRGMGIRASRESWLQLESFLGRVIQVLYRKP